MSVRSSETWEDARANVLEVEADTINAAVFALDRLNGLFETRTKVANLLQECRDELNVQASNRMAVVKKARKGQEVVA